jgi:hypothetical protein
MPVRRPSRKMIRNICVVLKMTSSLVLEVPERVSRLVERNAVREELK